MTEGIRVLIVDDQPRTRQSLKALLATLREVGEVYEAETAMEAIQCVRELEPDVVVMDVRMPEMDGLQATRLIKSARPNTRIVILTLYGDYRQEALAAGADQFLIKGGPSSELLDALLGRSRSYLNHENQQQ